MRNTTGLFIAHPLFDGFENQISYDFETIVEEKVLPVEFVSTMDCLASQQIWHKVQVCIFHRVGIEALARLHTDRNCDAFGKID